MPKQEWGTKRVCPTTGKRFYDLNRDPIVSPYTGEVVTFDQNAKARTAIPNKTTKKAETEETVDLVEDDDDAVLSNEDDTDLDDDILEDDEDDNVSLDDIADVASDEDDS